MGPSRPTGWSPLGQWGGAQLGQRDGPMGPSMPMGFLVTKRLTAFVCKSQCYWLSTTIHVHVRSSPRSVLTFGMSRDVCSRKQHLLFTLHRLGGCNIGPGHSSLASLRGDFSIEDEMLPTLLCMMVCFG